MKIRITDKSVRKLLLRVSNIDEYNRKKAEYEIITKLSRLAIPMSMPVDFSVCSSGEKVYSLLTWVEGEDAHRPEHAGANIKELQRILNA